MGLYSLRNGCEMFKKVREHMINITGVCVGGKKESSWIGAKTSWGSQALAEWGGGQKLWSQFGAQPL